MTNIKAFDLIVEGKSDDTTKVVPNDLELHLAWEGDAPPDVVVMERGTLLIKVGRYASSGERYRYRVATTAKLRAGVLVP